MKAKHAITLLVLGYCLDFFGAVRKITHSPDADYWFYAAAILKIVGGLLFLYKLLTYPKFREFMNW
jgi:hypothetical protein